MTDTQAIAEGRVARVVGPVVDVDVPPDRIPPLYNALTVEVNLAGQGEGESSFTMTLEVAQHLGDNLVRTIALKPTDGSLRGAPVTDTGAPISVPRLVMSPRPRLQRDRRRSEPRRGRDP